MFAVFVTLVHHLAGAVTLDRPSGGDNVTLVPLGVTLFSGSGLTSGALARPHPLGGPHTATEGVGGFGGHGGHVVGVLAVGEEDAEALDATRHEFVGERRGRLVTGGIVVIRDEDPGHTETGEGLGVIGREAGGPVRSGDVLEPGAVERQRVDEGFGQDHLAA